MAKKFRKKRSMGLLSSVERFYIFCEGKATEDNYFKGFKKEIKRNPIYKNAVHIEVILGCNETIKVVEEAEKFVKNNHIQYGRIWCVFDKDDFTSFDEAIDKVENLNKDKDNNLIFNVAWSNECIEYWFLSHFCYQVANNGRKQYIETLNKQFNKYRLPEYSKNMINIFDILLNYGNPKSATKYCKKRYRDFKKSRKPPSLFAPCTTIFFLIEELANYLSPPLKEKFI